MERGNVSGKDGIKVGKSAMLESRIYKTMQKVKEFRAQEEAREIDQSCLSAERNITATLNEIEKNAEAVIGDIFGLLLTDAVRGKRLLQTAFSNLLVVTKQPPRILRYKKEYTVSVRLLLGETFLDYFRIQKNSKLSIQAFCISGGNDEPSKPSTGARSRFSSIVSIATSYFEQGPEGLLANIKFSITPKMIRGKRKLDEKRPNSIDSCQIFFSVVVGFNGGREGVLESFTSTFPLKVVMAEEESDEDDGVIESSQIWPSPMDDVIWRNAVGNLTEPKQMPEKLQFNLVNQAIEAKFRQFTGRSLSVKDMETIQQKFFSSQFLQKAKADSSLQITYSDFMKAIHLQESETQKMSVTYWGWFYHLAKFIQSNLEFQDEESGSAGSVKISFWKEGYVQGYMTSQEVAKMLKDSSDWTFLLRFSNTVPTAVTIDWKQNNGIYSYRGSGSELRLRNLVDRILDTPRWKYFYPGTEKESLLLRFTTSPELPRPSPGYNPSKPGYVIARLRSHLDLPDETDDVENKNTSYSSEESL